MAGDDLKPERREQVTAEPSKRNKRESKMATKLFVGNLSFNTTEGDVLDLFKTVGNVTSCALILDKMTNKSRGFAFVEMASQEDATKAIAELNGKELDGRAMNVSEARPREERPRGGGGGFGGGGHGGGRGFGGGGGGGGYGGGHGGSRGSRRS